MQANGWNRIAALWVATWALWVVPALAVAQGGGSGTAGGPSGTGGVGGPGGGAGGPAGAGDTGGGTGWLWLVLLAVVALLVFSRMRRKTARAR